MEQVKIIELVDAKELRRLYPETFEVPSDHEIEVLEVGQLIKVSAYGERFWVKIVEVHENKFICAIDNYLLDDRIGYGDLIEVSANNIYLIYDGGV